MIPRRQNAAFASKLIGESLAKQGIVPGQVTLHSDRGSPMRAKSHALQLADLGVVQSFGRPHVSDDNPFSEAQFKTAKYHPTYPDRFGSLEDDALTSWPSSTGTTTNTATAHSAG